MFMCVYKLFQLIFISTFLLNLNGDSSRVGRRIVISKLPGLERKIMFVRDRENQVRSTPQQKVCCKYFGNTQRILRLVLSILQSFGLGIKKNLIQESTRPGTPSVNACSVVTKDFRQNIEIDFLRRIVTTVRNSGNCT